MSTVSGLRSHPIACIQGNYDDSVGNGLEDCQCGYTDPMDNHYAQISYDYTLSNTSTDHRAWLAGLPPQARIRIGTKDVLARKADADRIAELLAKGMGVES